jgi:transposase-like protein
MSRPTAKRCPRCGQVKAAEEFYWRRGGRRRSPYCQPCTRAASREVRTRRRQDLAAAEQLRAVDRARQRRHRTLGGPGPSGGDAA